MVARRRRRKTAANSMAAVGQETQEKVSFAEKYAAYRANRPQSSAGKQVQEFAGRFDFPFDDYQIQANQALAEGKTVLVAAPTGAGKTVVGEFAVFLALKHQTRTFYTTPIKALSNQKYRDLVASYGSEQVGLLTGDVTINAQAPIVVMTTEVLRNMLYRADERLTNLEYVVLDEVHYLADRFRGPVWEEVILNLDPKVQVVALSATVSNAEEFGAWLREVRGSVKLVVSENRPVPLEQHMIVAGRLYPLYAPTKKETPSKRLNPALLAALPHPGAGGRGRRGRQLPVTSAWQALNQLKRSGLLPAIYFVFSRAGCEQARDQVLAAGVDLTSEQEKQQITAFAGAALAPFQGADWANFDLDRLMESWTRGVATHHAGLLPVFKEIVEEMFTQGWLKVVFATETLALGINMPARAVVIQSLRKWDGSDFQLLTPGQYTQLTGRAGRRGIDTVGHAVVLGRSGVNPAMVSALASKRTYPLSSAFHPTYNMAVNLLATTSLPQAHQILKASFAQFQIDRQEASRLQEKADLKRATADRILASGKINCHLGDLLEYGRLADQYQYRFPGRPLPGAATAGQKNQSPWTEEVVSSRNLNSEWLPENWKPANRKLIKGLRRGDIIATADHPDAPVTAWLLLRVQTPGRDHWESRRHQGPVLTLLTRQAKIVKKPLSELSGPLKLAAQLHIPEDLKERQPRDRQRLASKLRSILQLGVTDELFTSTNSSSALNSEPANEGETTTGTTTKPTAPSPAVNPVVSPTVTSPNPNRPLLGVDADLATIPDQLLIDMLAAHPVAHCPQLPQHLAQAKRWLRLDRQANHFQNRADQVSCYLNDCFTAIVKVLSALGYVDEQGSVQPAGQLLRSIYAESDLLLAEALRRGYFDNLDPVSLAAVVSAASYQARKETLASVVPAVLQEPVRKIQTLASELRKLQEKVLMGKVVHSDEDAVWTGRKEGFSNQVLDIFADLTTGFDTSTDLVSAVVAWANGEPLSTALHLADLEAGDFVRAIKQLIEVLRQIEMLSNGPVSLTAHRARKLLHRGVIAWSEL